MNKKLTPHIIAVMTLVVFIVLGLACASAPPPPRKFTPPMPLTQGLMYLDDPRMPTDIFDNGKKYKDFTGKRNCYWLGTLAPEPLAVKPGFLYFLDGHKIYDLFVDGIKINLIRDSWSMVGLTPGKHTFRFTYRGTIYPTKNSSIDINTSNITVTSDIQSGKWYSIVTSLGQDALERHSTAVHGYGRYNISFEVSSIEAEWHDETPPSLQVGFNSWKDDINLVYLEPYDSNIPLESQSFLEIRFSIYVVDFDGKEVSWGGGKNDHVNIGIPAGKHELHLANLNTNSLYSMIIDAIPQRRYALFVLSSGKIVLADQAVDNKYFVATEIGKFTRPK